MAKLTKQQALAKLDEVLWQVDTVKRGEPLSPAFHKWRRDAEVAIRYTFGEQSNHLEEFRAIDYTALPLPITRGQPNPGQPAWERRWFSEGMEKARAMLQSMLDEVREFWPDDAALATNTGKPGDAAPVKPLSNKVFIVHGHDRGLKEAVARFLTHIGLEPIILHEQPNQGRTIIEKFQDYADVSYAIALFTPDDVGANVRTPEALQARARQNVIFEFGYFIGKLGRKYTCALVMKGVERPSDYDGVLYIPVDESERWRFDLVKELKAVSFDIDANRALF